MKVYWTDEALKHLDNIHRHIAEDSPVYARRMGDNITRRSQQIGGFPQSGRTVPEYQDIDIREVIEPPYRIVIPHYAESSGCPGGIPWRTVAAGRFDGLIRRR